MNNQKMAPSFWPPCSRCCSWCHVSCCSACSGDNVAIKMFTSWSPRRLIVMWRLWTTCTHTHVCVSKGKGLDTCYSATYMSQTHDQQRFTISEVAADWHEPSSIICYWSKGGNRRSVVTDVCAFVDTCTYVLLSHFHTRFNQSTTF